MIMGECAPGGCKKIFLSAERVFPLLEEFWAKEPGLSTMEETTEKCSDSVREENADNRLVAIFVVGVTIVLLPYFFS